MAAVLAFLIAAGSANIDTANAAVPVPCHCFGVSVWIPHDISPHPQVLDLAGAYLDFLRYAMSHCQ